MKRMPYWLLTLLLVHFSGSAILLAAPTKPHQHSAAPAAASQDAATTASTGKDSITHHAITVRGQELAYTATAGTLPLKDDAGKVQANIFYVAYVKDGPADVIRRRPLIFAFNGGPGASAIWLHLGALGPRRVVFAEDGKVLARAYGLVDNEETWLEFADLVFVDPVGTGYSRPAPGVDAKKYYEYQGDIQAGAAFIRHFVTRYGRWLSPKLIVGESYGSTRAAALAEHLQTQMGLNLCGVVLISSVLDFRTISFDPGNDLGYALGLPTCAAAALYHHKTTLPSGTDLKQYLADVAAWALGDYLSALARGDDLPPPERARIAARLAAITGLPKQYIVNNRLRVSTHHFVKELLRDEGRVLGLMDSRVTGEDNSSASEYAQNDPAFFLATGPLVATINDYLRRELGYESQLSYEYFAHEVNHAWKWGSDGRYLFVTDNLARAMADNRWLKVFAAAGLYDLTTPYLSQKYSIDHLGLDDRLRPNVTFNLYPSGHQIYTSPAALRQLRADAGRFVQDAAAEDLTSTTPPPAAAAPHAP